MQATFLNEYYINIKKVQINNFSRFLTVTQIKRQLPEHPNKVPLAGNKTQVLLVMQSNYNKRMSMTISKTVLH